MSELNVNKIVGESFEDMSIAEMTLVQGSGDVQLRSTPATVTAATVTIATPVASRTLSHVISHVVSGKR